MIFAVVTIFCHETIACNCVRVCLAFAFSCRCHERTEFHMALIVVLCGGVRSMLLKGKNAYLLLIVVCGLPIPNIGLPDANDINISRVVKVHRMRLDPLQHVAGHLPLQKAGELHQVNMATVNGRIIGCVAARGRAAFFALQKPSDDGSGFLFGVDRSHNMLCFQVSFVVFACLFQHFTNHLFDKVLLFLLQFWILHRRHLGGKGFELGCRHPVILDALQIFHLEEVTDQVMEHQKARDSDVGVNALVPFHVVIQPLLRKAG